MGMVKSSLVKLTELLFRTVQTISGLFSNNNKLVLLVQDGHASKEPEIVDRLNFFLPSFSGNFVRIRTPFSRWLLNFGPLLIVGPVSGVVRFICRFRKFTYHVDYDYNPLDGWAWCQFSSDFGAHTPDLTASKQKFKTQISSLQIHGYEHVYLFGTGPSLARAMDRDWGDGYRVVCNTIVRDKELWQHIDPHFVVAGDAIYHFGHTAFARSFRTDLRKRLLETDTFFLYPSMYHEIVSRELADVAEKLIPIPYSISRRMHDDIHSDFSIPKVGNVLNQLLLPLGCTLAKDVCLWGFDGRAPDDKLFWSNSQKHSYPEHMQELQNAHPAFFNHYVPKENPESYVKAVHGDSLDMSFVDAEAEGWRFRMLHDSYTPTLQKRRSD